MSRALEERIAHLEREVSDLSAVVARQDEELRRLSALAERLAERIRERAAEGGGGVVLGDERPPHW
jgi:SlyX protein